MAGVKSRGSNVDNMMGGNMGGGSPPGAPGKVKGCGISVFIAKVKFPRGNVDKYSG